MLTETQLQKKREKRNARRIMRAKRRVIHTWAKPKRVSNFNISVLPPGTELKHTSKPNLFKRIINTIWNRKV